MNSFKVLLYPNLLQTAFMPAPNFAAIRRKLLRWYQRNKRDLPWRRTRDPYAIWIAETMLQQTRVETVLPYYEKFLRAFPTIQALRRAPLDRILRAWAGLGYYRRAENLKKAARQITRDHGGQMPREYEKLRGLAGVGDYTAGAVLSIAFQQRYPAVDGNARRVLGRLLNPGDEKELFAKAAALVSRSRPGDFNQAIMELGSTTCITKAPRCNQCPLSAECSARTGQEVRLRSSRQKQNKFKDVVWPLAIVRFRGKVLLRRRGANGLLARLWELPGAEAPRLDRVVPTLRGELAELGYTRIPPRPIAEIRHSITNRRIRAPVYLVEYPVTAAPQLGGKRWRWIAPAAGHNHAVSSMTVKALRTLKR